MRKFLVAVSSCALLSGAVLLRPASAAPKTPRQVVVIVADGVSPQVLQFGADFTKAAGDADTVSALAGLKAQAPVAAEGVSVDSLKGVLKTAASNGWKTGLVTTSDTARDAATLYDLPADTAAASLVKNAPFNFVAGGGRASFAPDAKQAITAAGGTALFDAAAVENGDQEIKGKTLILQNDGPLSYAIDQDPENEAAFSELVSLAMETLGENDAPYLLVVHETNVNKALAAKDSPALAEELRTLDGIVGDVVTAREDNPGLALALIGTGGTPAPSFTTAVEVDRSNALFILSQLSMSYAKAGTTLTGADEEKLNTFATDEYKGWKLSAETRAAILAGTMTPEAAIRASYEPALTLGYTGDTASVAYVLGLDAANPAQTLGALAGRKPAPAAAPTL